MTPIELKQWQANLSLSELAMAHYLGVPVHTLKKWVSGARTMDAAPKRLVQILARIQTDAPALHGELLREARAAAPESAPRARGRPPRITVAQTPIDAPQAPESPILEIPAWLSSAV